jgi:hypothetical protein
VVVQVEALALGRVVVAVRLLIAVQRVAATVLQGRAELAKTEIPVSDCTTQQNSNCNKQNCLFNQKRHSQDGVILAFKAYHITDHVCEVRQCMKRTHGMFS